MVLDVHSGTLPQWPGYQKAAALCPVNRLPVYQTRQCLANLLSIIIATRVCLYLVFPTPNLRDGVPRTQKSCSTSAENQQLSGLSDVKSEIGQSIALRALPIGPF